MNFPAFRLSLLTLALTCAWGAQAATARTDIARPTDFAAQSVSQGPIVCQSSKVKTCGRRVAGKLGMPAGSAPKSAYRFVEEEFLFDSGVAIFLETAVPENRNAHAGWRRRLAFRKTAEGFQLVQVGIQYRCQGGSWQKEACGSASQLVRRKTDGKGVPQAQAQAGGAAGRASSGAASAATQAGAAGAAAVTAAQAASGAGQDAPNRIVSARASAGQPGQDASRTANTQDPAVRVLRSDRSDAGVRSATPVETISPNEQEAVPALDARWRPRQDAIEQDEAVTAAYDQKQRVAEAESQRHAAEQAEAARKAGTSDRAADLDALRRDEAIANRGLSEEDALVAARERQKGAAGQGASQMGANRSGASVSGSVQGNAAGHADRKGAQSAHAAADIVAANPSISADQLKQMHAAEASLARATAGSAPGVVDAGAASSDQEGAGQAQTGPAMIDHRTDARGAGAADQEPAGEGAGQRTGKEGRSGRFSPGKWQGLQRPGCPARLADGRDRGGGQQPGYAGTGHVAGHRAHGRWLCADGAVHRERRTAGQALRAAHRDVRQAGFRDALPGAGQHAGCAAGQPEPARELHLRGRPGHERGLSGDDGQPARRQHRVAAHPHRVRAAWCGLGGCIGWPPVQVP